MKTIKATWPGALALLLAAPTQALEWTTTIGVAEEYSDNAQRRADDTAEEDFTHSPQVTLNVVESSRALRLGSAYSLRRNYFERHTADTETALTGNTNFAWAPFGETLIVEVDHVRNQSLRDSRLVDNPANRQTTDQLTTRLVGNLVQGRNTFALVPTASRTTASQTGNDSGRFGGQLAWRHEFRKGTHVGLLADWQKVEYADPRNPDFLRDVASVTFARASRRLNVSGEAGVTRTRREIGKDVQGFSGSLIASYRFSSRTDISLNARRSIDDRSDALGRFDPLLQTVRAESDLADIVVNTTATVTVAHTFSPRTSADFRVFVNDEAYEVADRDSQTLGAAIAVNRRIVERVQASLGISYTSGTYDQPDQDNDLLSATLAVTWNMTRDLSLIFAGRHQRRAADLDVQDFDENAFGMTMRWRLSNVE